MYIIQLNIERKSTKEFLQSLKEQNYTIYGTDVANGEKLSDVYADYEHLLTKGSFTNVWSYQNWKNIVV